MKNILMLPVLLIGLQCCLPSGKEKESSRETPKGFGMIHYFEAGSGLWGDSEYGLIRSGDRVFAVLTGDETCVWSARLDGSDTKKVVLHGVQEVSGIKVNVQYGLLKAGAKIYGVTSKGGKYDAGTIYSVDPLTSELNIEYDFDGLVYGSPACLPVCVGDSVLTGLVGELGSSSTWYRFNVKTGKMTSTIVCNSERVGMASSALFFQAAPGGTVYANDMLGYQSSFGYVFKMNDDLKNETLIYEFDSIKGSMPGGEMVFHDKRIYGTATGGGQGDNGLVYSMNEDGTAYRVLAQFNGKNGHLPEGLLLASDGMLYGTCFSGGEQDGGVLYRLSKDGTDFEILHHFDETQGEYPNGSLAEDEAGNIYGLLRSGGKDDKGGLFRYTVK